jgi:hypothetical protein
MNTILPSTMKQELRVRGYSEESANIITAQYLSHPDDRRYWGTEEQTRQDIESIVQLCTSNTTNR